MGGHSRVSAEGQGRTCCLRTCWVRREPPLAPTRPPTPSCPGRLAPGSGRFVFIAFCLSSSACRSGRQNRFRVGM